MWDGIVEQPANDIKNAEIARQADVNNEQRRWLVVRLWINMCLWELGELTFDNSGREGFSRAAWHHLAQLVGPQGAQDVPHQLRKHEGKSVEQRENKRDGQNK